MKYSNILIIFITLICLSGNTNEAASAVHATALSQGSQAKTALAQLFTVAETEEPIYLILIEKNLQRLRVLEHNGELKVVAEYFSATGENFGIKEISGDAKTPEGIYFITKVFIDKKVTIFGDKAFHLDYPNFYDIEAGRNGDGIYIHGTNKELKPNSTNGCITMINNDLDDLEKYLNQAVTPVVIVPELKLDKHTVNQLLTKQDFDLAKSLLLNDDIKPDKVEYNYLYVINLGSQAVAVADFVYRPHERSMMRGASRSYLEYRTGNGWITRKRILRATPLQIYPESQVKIAARPFAVEQVQITGQPAVDTSSMVAALEPASQSDTNNSMQEDTPVQPLPEPAKKSTTEQPPAKEPDKPQADRPAAPKAKPEKIALVQVEETVAAKLSEPHVTIAAQPPGFPKDEEAVKSFVENWRQTWVSKEIDSYINHYDSAFQQGNKNLSQYKAHKEKLNRTYQFIKVDISQIKISWTKKGATVSFRQEYQSDQYKTSGSKTLILVYNDSGWKIKREMYSGKKSS
jgi:murein L,D-transpeptidase YafK